MPGGRNGDEAEPVVEASGLVLRDRRRAEELDEEMALHAELRARRLREYGLEPDEAEFAARRGFGNRTRLKEKSREVWAFAPMETIWPEVRLAGGVLRRSPGFTVTVLLTLALGIGANTAVISVVEAALLRPLPYRDSGRVVLIWETQKRLEERPHYRGGAELSGLAQRESCIGWHGDGPRGCVLFISLGRSARGGRGGGDG